MSIVTYNTWPRTLENITSLLDSLAEYECEILVYDNGAAPAELPPLPPRVVISRGESNIGFGAGNNRNLDRARFDRFFIINPDITSNANAIRGLIERLKTLNTVAVSPLLLEEDGSVQHSFRRLPSLKSEWARVFGLDRKPGNRYSTVLNVERDSGTQIVEQPAGAALLLRTELMRTIGGFDEGFPMYFEDVDLCRRLRDHGEILVDTQCTFIHDGEGTAKSYRRASTFWIENSRKRYFRKHSRGPARPLHWALGLVSCTTHAAATLTFHFVTRDPKRRQELREKSAGYGLAIASYFGGTDDFWKRKMMSQA